MGIIFSFISCPPLPARWWGLKVLPWLILLAVSFTIPSGFFVFLGNYMGKPYLFSLGLFSSSVGSAVGLYAAVITLTAILYAFFAGSGSTLNQFFISFNLVLCVIITHPVVQEANPRSTLLQSGMVAAYCTYLIISAVGNHTHKMCNPLRNGTGSATHNTTVVLGAVFTFLAIAYSTTRAAAQKQGPHWEEAFGCYSTLGRRWIS